MIIKVYEETLRNGEKVSSSKYHVQCDYVDENGEQCGKSWDCIHGNYVRKKRKEDYCRSHNNKLGISGIKGRGHSEEFKQKLAARMTENNPMHKRENRKKVSAALKAKYKVEAHHMLGKKRPEHAEFMRDFMEQVMDPDNDYRNEFRAKLLFDKRRHSKFHKRVKASLESAGYTKFETEKMIGKYLVDECWEDKKIVLELHGGLWHMDPTIYKSTDLMPLKGARKTAQDVWDTDAKKKAYLEERGYTVIYIWDSQFVASKWPWDAILGVDPE